MPLPKLIIPSLSIPVKRLTIGSVYWEILASFEEEILSIEQINVSPRRTEQLYKGISGNSFIITEKASCPHPEGITGILQKIDQNKLKWVSHSLANEITDKAFPQAWPELCDEVISSWHNNFQYTAEEKDHAGNIIRAGLRPPQIGAIHAIAAHWSLNNTPATIVMPTGTGKTEIMLATLVSMIKGKLLIVVPSIALRSQAARKFSTFGLLRDFGNIPYGAKNPIVGIIDSRPKSAEDWQILECCNVIVATISVVSQGEASEWLEDLAARCSHLFIDEAHHIAADSWNALRDAFTNKPIIQYTATPFRRDGKSVEGKVIYNYPLKQAQKDGYFKPINFTPVFEINFDNSDNAIAEKAVAQLKSDLDSGYNHLLMVRCNSIEKAATIYDIYRRLGASHNPVLVHNKAKDVEQSLEKLINGTSRIVVCVDMLGEGFDLPALKIAALHDTHKTLSVLLQFIGRFTRSAGVNIGNATVIANAANANVPNALDKLYSEDADWNEILSEFASQAVSDHVTLVEFLQNSKRIDKPSGSDETANIAPKTLLPKFSAVVYRCNTFAPKLFYSGVNENDNIHAAWINEADNVLFFITKSEQRVQWARSKALLVTEWHLYVIYYNPHQKLLYIHSSNKESLHNELAKAVSRSTSELISGDNVFRALGGINRLMFQNVGLKKHGRRNLRFSMYSGSDVAEALNPAHTANSTKSNVAGGGFENGEPVTIGCSYKGRVWARDQGTIRQFLKWCDSTGTKLSDDTIDTESIIQNVLIPVEVKSIPNSTILCLDWPHEILDRHEDEITLQSSKGSFCLSLYGIEYLSVNLEKNEIIFRIYHESHLGIYALRLKEANGYEIAYVYGEKYNITLGKNSYSLEAWLSEYPPNIIYVDGSELDGCLLITPKARTTLILPSQKIEPWNWNGVDITKESIWKNGRQRVDSIQFKVAHEQQALGFDIIFDDDGAGEAADLVCLKEHPTHIQLRLLHCKYSGNPEPGERVKDVVEVGSQAIRSSRWKWRVSDLCRHLVTRENQSNRAGVTTRFIVGDCRKINQLVKMSRFKTVVTEVVIVQPGLSKATITEDQAMILNSVHGYLMETVNIGLDVICSE